MANFVTDNELSAAASRLAHSMLTMCDKNGIPVDYLGTADPMDRGALEGTFQAEAEFYMAMNPTLLVEEYDEIRLAASQIGPDSDPNSTVAAATIDLAAVWHGSAAQAFFAQLEKLEKRIVTQHDYTLLAAQAVSMMYAVNVTFRRSCHDMMQQTAIVCDAVADHIKPNEINWGKVIIDVAGKLIDAVRNPKQIADMVIDEVMNLAGKLTEDKPVDGAEAIPVINGYIAARDGLFDSYQDALGGIEQWLHGRRKEFAGLDNTLPEPLPAFCDVDSPDFRYENFFLDGHAPGDYTQEVERERQRYVEEKAKPGGIIMQRLTGER